MKQPVIRGAASARIRPVIRLVGGPVVGPVSETHLISASRMLLLAAGLLLPGLAGLALTPQSAHGQNQDQNQAPAQSSPDSTAPDTRSPDAAPGAAATPDTTMPPAAAPMTPQMYVDLAATGDMFEIEASKLALINSDNKDVKEFARHMVQDHTQSADKLKGVVKEKNVGVTVPTGLDDAHVEMLDQLQAAKGEDFDKLYLKMQEEGHQQALKLQQAYADNGDAAELKTYATVMVPVIEKHLTALDKLVRAVNGNT